MILFRIQLNLAQLDESVSSSESVLAVHDEHLSRELLRSRAASSHHGKRVQPSHCGQHWW